ncbi:MAG: hypothetical protein LBT78_00370 [Tannerella sp.]|jgi:hypothetical protein|nr:hypothetical protein [Tannerella sp.]
MTNENNRFRVAFEKLSEKDKNKIAGIENDRTPEEEEYLKTRAKEILEQIRKEKSRK